MAEGPPSRFDIGNVKLLASYNWLGSKYPTILVPGLPATWSPPARSPYLPPDTGTRALDQNAFRSPQSPMQLLFAAVLHLQPEYDFSNVGLITDRWAFSQLLRYFGELPGGNFEFGFQAQIVGNTIVFMSIEAGNAEVVGTGPKSFRGFRDNFNKEYLQYRADCADSVSHYSIVEYDFGGTKILLRHKVNGFLVDKAPEALVDLLTLEVPISTESGNVPGGIAVCNAGCLVSQAAHLELSTAKSVDTVEKYLEKEMPEQWISQTPNYVRVVLDYGDKWRKDVSSLRAAVKEIEIRDSREDVSEWVDQKQDSIAEFQKGLSSLLTELRSPSEREGRDMFLVKHEANARVIKIENATADLPRLAPETCSRITQSAGPDTRADSPSNGNHPKRQRLA